MLLKDKNILLTGCNRGIGLAILRASAKEGANLWACARKESEEFRLECEELAENYGVTISPVYFDLADEEQIKAAMNGILAEKRPIDVLINNAGVTYNALCQMTSLGRMKELMEINYYAPYLITQYVVKSMLRNKSGSIIQISSTSGLDANEGRSAYGASKAALINTTKTLAAEFGSRGIRVNTVAPGMTKTDMVFSHTPEDIIAQTTDKTMLKRLAEPEEIANAVVFLASDLSSYITGQTIRVDGGLR